MSLSERLKHQTKLEKREDSIAFQCLLVLTVLALVLWHFLKGN